MRPLALALLAAFVTLTSVAQTEPQRPASQDKAFAKLRGITQFYIDVTTSENRPEDADLRTEIRDGMELELRRANLTPKATSTPPVTRSSALVSPGLRNSLARGMVAAISTANQASVSSTCRHARKNE